MHLFHSNKFQDEIQVELETKANTKQSLDELSREVNEWRAELTKTKNDETPTDSVSDGAADGNSPHAALGEIDKIKKIIEILENIVVPTIVNRQNAEEQHQKVNNADPSPTSSDPINILPKGFKLLQHHSITSDDGSPAAAVAASTNQKL